MDSSNAEKAWAEYRAEQTAKYSDGPLAAHPTFMAGRASRDAEVAELREQLAAAEAVIEKVRSVVTSQSIVRNTTVCIDTGLVTRVLVAAPSVVLEDRDRENRAIGWDEGATALDEWNGAPLDEGGSPVPENPYRGDKQ